MPSFDTILEANLVELKNAVDVTVREVGTRFDFKGSSANLELKDKTITLYGDSDFQIGQVDEVLRNKLAKRGVDVRFLDADKIERSARDKVKQVVTVRNGIEADVGKKIQQAIKASKLKVQAAIQDGKVRVTGAKRDDLQTAMAVIRKEMTDLPLSFDNFRD